MLGIALEFSPELVSSLDEFNAFLQATLKNQYIGSVLFFAVEK